MTNQDNTSETPRFTKGPWRWEVNEKSKVVELCGGPGPRYDLTVMDFERWGMSNAIPRFRDNDDRGLLDRCLKWAKKVIGREHHAHWFKTLDHPDAHLIAAAPDLYSALTNLLERHVSLVDSGDAGLWDPDTEEEVIQARAALASAQGKGVEG